MPKNSYAIYKLRVQNMAHNSPQTALPTSKGLGPFDASSRYNADADNTLQYGPY